MTAIRPEDPDLLIDLIRRSPLLEELQQDALDRAELQDRLAVSRATCHRHTRTLDELGVIERVDSHFQLTEAGWLLTDALTTFKRDARSAVQLAPVLDAVGDAPGEIDAKAFADATVTSAERGDPYSPVARFITLVRETEALRGLDMDAIAPLYMDEIQKRIVGGMETEDITHPGAVKDSLDGYPDKCMEACASGYLTVQLYDDLPFGLAIFDDRVGIGVCEQGTRNLRVFVDTDSPAVREWAESVYEVYESEAILLEEYTQQGFREAIEA
ncbi:winged helix-turn-helix domain-containing protein [Halomicroarcula sp. F13]|uniref:Winged helix-turn-helix domain-containing protein n=1 Tax=Haloarcula rubra TaxID=2487747 RepID=A0AAW4PWP0_9EURY|nr:winged helix-turn-helix domain-containing protein [Halomicroarcula rubra]MBX0325596.1 winged helix-turn-helix domain-containing protein [Halomicroarcula rubra]